MSVSQWKGHRWQFQDGETIVAEVKIGAGRPIAAGRPAPSYCHGSGAGTSVLDGETLQPLARTPRPRDGPRVLPLPQPSLLRVVRLPR